MIKLYLFSLFVSFIFLLSCNSLPNSSYDKLKVDSLQYSAYRWRTNLQTQEWEMFLAYYIKIDNEGYYVAMRHNTTPEPAQYFKGNIDSSTKHLIDSLSIVRLDTAYFSPELRIYDGNVFQLSFANSREHDINYYQIDAPPFLQRLSTTLDSLIFKSKDKVAPFDLSYYESELERQSLKRLGGLPKLQKAPAIKMKLQAN